MIDPEIFCEPDESIAGLEDNSTGCLTYLVHEPGRGENDCVFLDVRKESTACILIGGNPFTIQTLHGFGRVALVKLETGERQDIFLEPGVDVEIPLGVAFSYANCGEEGSQLILRDTGLDFDLADEITVEGLVSALSNLSALVAG